MTFKRATLVTAALLSIVGILGFVPAMSIYNADGQQMLFGIFMVGLFHNVFHLVSGLMGLLAGTNETYAKWYLRVFGLVYAMLAVIGFSVGIANVNMADNLLHISIAVLLLGLTTLLNSESSSIFPAQQGM